MKNSKQITNKTSYEISFTHAEVIDILKEHAPREYPLPENNEKFDVRGLEEREHRFEGFEEVPIKLCWTVENE